MTLPYDDGMSHDWDATLAALKPADTWSAVDTYFADEAGDFEPLAPAAVVSRARRVAPGRVDQASEATPQEFTKSTKNAQSALRWLSLTAGILLMLGGLKLAFWPGAGADSFASSKTLVANSAEQSSPFDFVIDDDPASQFVKVAVPIEKVELGQRSVGQNLLRWQVSDEPEPTAETHREVRFEMLKPSGLRLWMRFIWPLEQIAESGAAPGKTIHFDLEEKGIRGEATCTFVGPCPEIQGGSGNVVTGLFEHETDPGSKSDFVAAEHLRAGTMLLTRAGPIAIASITSRSATPGERVYNLQIHGQHIYQVTAVGVLVHDECYVYRELNALDRQRLDQGLDLLAKGSGGEVADQVAGRGATRFISASQTAEAAARYSSRNGLVRIDVRKAIEMGAGFVDHKNVLQAVRRNGMSDDFQNARRALEVMFKNYIPRDAIELIKP